MRAGEIGICGKCKKCSWLNGVWGKNPKNVWSNDVVKAPVKRTKDKVEKERCMEIYKK